MKSEARSRDSFDLEWHFARFGLMPDESRKDEPYGIEKPEFDDSKWRILDLPHDWGIEGSFRDDLEAGTGKLPWKGIGWYRKRFDIPSEDNGRRIFIDFDGAMANAKVWLNGIYLGTWPYGYSSFRMDLTGHLNFGAKNIIAVRLDTEKWDSRWYPGAGIYRHVWMVKTAQIHIAHCGTYVTTPEINDEKGELRISATVENNLDSEIIVTVEAEIREFEANGKIGGKVAISATLQAEIARQGNSTVNLSASVTRPKLWDIESPQRYIARVVVKSGELIVDAYDTPFGFRSIEFTPRNGFRLNGRRVNINGTCNHHDHGALGSALNECALERQLKMLREMGCNALRTSHNPPAPELLDLADKMGFLVQVEAFDCWAKGKCPNDYNLLFKEWHDRDLKAMVRRDRNHPCVFMWSIGNEILEQDNPELAGMLWDIVKAEDPTRPVVACCNNGNALFNGFEYKLDVLGCNYNLDRYESFLACHDHQEIPIHASETASCISSRGEYFFPVLKGKDSEVNFQVSSYDIHMPCWGCTPDEQFMMLDRFPSVMGEFVWTGWDYLGEPTPYNSDITNLLNTQDPELRRKMQKEIEELGFRRRLPRSSYFGIIDLAGFKKDRFYIYQARWCPELPMAHLFPHWNWAERIGRKTPVHLYTSGDEAELFLNGKSQGGKKRGEFEYRLKWDDVIYEPGEIRVIVLKKGREWAQDIVRTAGSPASLSIQTDCQTIANNGRDLAFLTVRVMDANGLTVPRADNLILFEIEGPGEIVATDNGDPTSFVHFKSRERKTFNGLCMAIISSTGRMNDKITLRAKSVGVREADVQIVASEALRI